MDSNKPDNKTEAACRDAYPKDKVQTLLGFAVKADKLIYGTDTIATYRKKMHLIFICHTLAENSLKTVRQTAQERNIPIIKTSIPLEKILFKTNCKVVALRDKQMADAIMLNINELKSDAYSNLI